MLFPAWAEIRDAADDADFAACAATAHSETAMLAI
jgi:hypothetical protein